MNKIKNVIWAMVASILCSPIQAQMLTINDIRNFSIDKNTLFTIDEVVIDPSTYPFEIIGTGGYKTRFRITDSVNATISQGVFSELHFISDIIGPITSLQPLTILDQQVFTTSNTFLKNIVVTGDLLINNLVSVSGAISEVDNSMQLSRLELNPLVDEWKLRGFARNITANTFTIGNLTIDRNAVSATNCSNGFVDNVFVSILANPDVGYSSGQTLTTLTSIDCETPDVDEDSNDTVPVVVEGVVSEIIDLVSFKINDLIVFFDSNTSFDNGEAEHIDVGTKVEVQGFLDTNNRFINADTIRFIDHRIKIVSPVTPGDIVIGESLSLLGVVIRTIPQTRDDNMIVTNGVNVNRQVEVRGFIDSEGNFYAQRIKDKGEEDSDDIQLRGDVTAVNQPIITVNGINIDSTSSIFELEEGIVSMEDFFAQLQVDMQLSIEDASYDSINNILSMGIITIAELELDDDADTDSFFRREIIGTGGIGIATVTATDVLFASGFEEL